MNGQKLRVIREFRNYSQEHIAGKLGISQNSYSRIENNQTKLTAERLKQLAAILNVPPEELLSDRDPVINFSIVQQGQEAQSQQLLEDTCQQFRQVITSKDEKIAFLENEINALRKERKRIIQVIERLTTPTEGR
jgi:transcriptional regulator with XRE-family HTH domain